MDEDSLIKIPDWLTIINIHKCGYTTPFRSSYQFIEYVDFINIDIYNIFTYN